MTFGTLTLLNGKNPLTILRLIKALVLAVTVLAATGCAHNSVREQLTNCVVDWVDPSNRGSACN